MIYTYIEIKYIIKDNIIEVSNTTLIDNEVLNEYEEDNSTINITLNEEMTVYVSVKEGPLYLTDVSM